MLIVWLPRMTVDLTQAILDWRDTNGSSPTLNLLRHAAATLPVQVRRLRNGG